ncbi:hypothetical protein [Comamonas sp. MYb396]|uniref:hypothetical protein n=1 Tax=Comamonas sp. MYb396 TaxID=2745302 RepID=UPI003095A308
MDTNQLIKAIGEAAVSTKLPQEYCLFWRDDWWFMCMSKSEWSSWAGVLCTLVIGILALYLPWRQRRHDLLINLRKEQELLESKTITAFEYSREACIGLFNSYQKFNGNSLLSPRSSLERLKSLERIGQSLISQGYPDNLLVSIMRVQRELALSIQAIEDIKDISFDNYTESESFRAANRLKNAREQRENLRGMLKSKIEPREEEFTSTHLP